MANTYVYDEAKAANSRGIMEARHSVRRYADTPVPAGLRAELDSYVRELNADSGLNIQIFYDEPACFGSARAKYGGFGACVNYISMVGGKKLPDAEERCGFYGELLVLKAQELGLNTCWVALTHGKTQAAVAADEEEFIVIALGFGANAGAEHKSKKPEDVSDAAPDSPEWYRRGVEAALLAPTAVNQQKFRFTRSGGLVYAAAGRIGPCLKIDLGIVKCHFELAAGKANFEWSDKPLK